MAEGLSTANRIQVVSSPGAQPCYDVAPHDFSISSSVRPLVSGTQAITNTMATTQKTPYSQNGKA